MKFNFQELLIFIWKFEIGVPFPFECICSAWVTERNMQQLHSCVFVVTAVDSDSVFIIEYCF